MSYLQLLQYAQEDKTSPISLLFVIAMQALDSTTPLPKRMVFTKVLAYNIVMLVMRTQLRHHMIYMVKQAVSMVSPTVKLPSPSKPPVEWLREVLQKHEEEGPEEWIERVAHVTLAILSYISAFKITERRMSGQPSSTSFSLLLKSQSET